jgi:hypothetical protein
MKMSVRNMSADLKIDVCQLSPMKCGTTWLSSMVAQHPELCAFNLNSENFDVLDKLVEKIGKELTGNQLLYARRNINPRHELASRLYKHNDEMKFIVLLRNPLDRLISHWIHHVIKMNAIAKPLHASIDVQKSLFEIRYDINEYIQAKRFDLRKMPPFLLKSLYYQNLDEYFKLFSPSQFLVIPAESLFIQPLKYLRLIFDFCGAPELEASQFESLTNISKNTASDMRENLSGLIPNRKRVFVPLDLKSRKILQEIFSEEIINVEDFLGRKIKHNWLYD